MPTMFSAHSHPERLVNTQAMGRNERIISSSPISLTLAFIKGENDEAMRPGETSKSSLRLKMASI
jgi:hypothetical protein